MEMAGTSYEDEDKSDHGKVLVTAWAGENWDELVAETIDWNVWGLENLSGIPGTVGAAPVQNIGAYGTEVMDLIASVRTMDSTNGSIKVFSNEECKFSYRESFFKTEEGKKYIITAVSFNLFQTPKPNLSYKDLRETFKDNLAPSLSDIREAVIEIRKGKFPELSQVGTAGSFWKNPIIPEEHFKQLQSKYPNIPSFPFKDQIKVPLAWILDNVCHLKGYVQGPISLWKNQPLVVVANENARASDIDLLAAEVAKRVKVETNIDIEREVQYVT
jgi:UDP-N-acetylmuramate dehydrogenase